MPLNDHPTGKPTYDFTTVTNIGPHGDLQRRARQPRHETRADPAVPGRAGQRDSPGAASLAGSPGRWPMPNLVQDYLVENSVGKYSNGYDDGVHGGAKIGADGSCSTSTSRPRRPQPGGLQQGGHRSAGNITNFQ